MCGAGTALCSVQEYGIDFDAIQASIPDAYPAFFCEDTLYEPVRIPSHPGEFIGARTDEDTDGDGIDNDTDNCPALYPIRPIDGGVQPDADGDGDGDACDDTPLPADIDADGTLNDEDNCPFTANENHDTDGDNKRDACDKCPDTPNPDSICPEVVTTVTIEQIRTDGSILDGDKVSVSSVVVTGTGDSGYTIQDLTDTWSIFRNLCIRGFRSICVYRRYRQRDRVCGRLLRRGSTSRCRSDGNRYGNAPKSPIPHRCRSSR